jgi:hypothetical protein
MTPLLLFTRITLLCTARNILAHVVLFKAAYLTPDEIGIFEKNVIASIQEGVRWCRWSL